MNNLAMFCEKKVSRLNDQLRKNPFNSEYGRIVLSEGILNISDNDRDRCISAMIEFNDFNQDNDPYSEHDMAGFNVRFEDGKERRLFFKIDYYDQDYKYLSENNRNNTDTNRVLTLMFASEY